MCFPAHSEPALASIDAEQRSPVESIVESTQQPILKSAEQPVFIFGFTIAEFRRSESTKRITRLTQRTATRLSGWRPIC